jgi:predicted Holliday junction resolvase-like endonuclease
MILPITERLAQLRKEIAQIRQQIDSRSTSVAYQNREASRQRQVERLEEIKDELRSLTQWKEP